ncbi:MAG: hypothetical protein GX964_09630 [Syntrophomonadaceae bacterium]|jgi:uncharacterized YkwD family protein|nr:hypothetical protein [Syntrophomonadaceae bacterium]
MPLAGLLGTNEAQALPGLSFSYDWSNPNYSWSNPGSSTGSYDWPSLPPIKIIVGGTYDWCKPPTYDWSNPGAGGDGNTEPVNPPATEPPIGGDDGTIPQPEPVPPVIEPPTQPEPEPPVVNPAPNARTADEQWMVTRLNEERTQRGLKPLQVDPALTDLARMKSQDMVDNDYFAHQSPTYGSPADMVKNAGITYWLCGENLARAGTVQDAHDLLMDSSGHRANILNSNYTHVGIGIVPQKSGRGVMVTQLFMAK